MLVFFLGGLGCATTVKRTWGDDDSTGRRRGGVVEYRRQDKRAAREAANVRATQDSQKWCGAGRDAHLTASPPFRRWESRYGFFGLRREKSWYERHFFVCAALDPLDDLYRLAFDDGVRCQPVPHASNPGQARFEAMMKAPKNEGCEARGWVVFSSDGGEKIVFFGSTGLATCQQLACEAGEQHLSEDQSVQWLQARRASHASSS